MKRRDFIKQGAAATAMAMAAGSPRAFADDKIVHPKASADTCILIWMAGGMAAPDTFDPKFYLPFSNGIEVAKVGSTFPQIDTAVDNIKITKGLENIAKVMDRGTLIRSHVQPDLGHILHSRHQYHWHTGYVPPLTVAAPHIGSWMSKVLGPKNDVIPAFIDIGQSMNTGEREELKAFHQAGFFGTEYGPFMLENPSTAISAVSPPKGMTPERFTKRYKYYRELIKKGPLANASSYQQESMLRSMENAYKLLHSPERVAFDLTKEKKEVYDQYNTGHFGRGCLLARRLTEAGARFIEVTTGYNPFKHWDTHENGHTTVAKLKQEIDRPIAQLILDLEERNLLDRTLVVIATEFSRDMMIEGVPGSKAKDQSRARTGKDGIQTMKQYGQHRHFTGGSSLLMFGGGIKKGHLYGETADERPFLTTKNKMSVMDVHATIFHAMGISPKTAFDIEKRPFYATQDGHGKVHKELFA